MLDEVRGRVQPGAGGDDRSEHRDMEVAVADRAFAASVQQGRCRNQEIHPPHPEGQTRPVTSMAIITANLGGIQVRSREYFLPVSIG